MLHSYPDVRESNHLSFLPVSYTLMTDCWKQNPEERPSFDDLAGRVEQLLLQENSYFDFNKVDESKAYYQGPEPLTAEIEGRNNTEDV